MIEIFDILHMVFVVGMLFFLLGAFWGKAFLYYLKRMVGFVRGPKYLLYRQKIKFKNVDDK